MIVAGVLIASLLVLLVYVIVKATWLRLSKPTTAATPTEPEDILSAARLKQLAEQAAQSGDFQAALRLRFRSVVNQLRMLDSERQTNWQLLRYVRRNHAAASREFAELISIFENSWYGGISVGQDGFARANELSAAVEIELTTREAAA
jgi:hypothetical protein